MSMSTPRGHAGMMQTGRGANRPTPGLTDHLAEPTEWFSANARPENSIDVTYPLTKEEAFNYVSSRLNIPDLEARIAGGDRVELLNLVVEGIKRQTPFTNILWHLSTPMWERDGQDMKEWMVAGKGGVCWMINPFTRAVLDRLGFKTYHIAGQAVDDKLPDTHICTIVEDAAYPGSIHLVDPGLWKDIYPVMSLDFQSESPEYKFHHMTVKLFREGGDRVILSAEAESVDPDDEWILYDANGKAWQARMILRTNERRNWHPFVQSTLKGIKFMTETGTMPPPFGGIVLFGYLVEEGTVVFIRAIGTRIAMYRYDREGKVRISNLSKPALQQFIKDRFPQYSEEELTEVFRRCPLT